MDKFDISYLKAKDQVLIAALRVVGHNYDQAEDPGWQGELDDEMLDQAVVDMASAIRLKRDSDA